jgi:hypothetical protein
VAGKVEPKGRGEMIRLNADVGVETFKRFRHALVEDRLTIAKWLRNSIDAHITERGPKGKRRKGKGA